MNFDTTVGRVVKVIIYAVVSSAVVGALNGALDALKVYEGVFPAQVFVALTYGVNTAIVAVRGYFDPKVKNI